MTCTKVNSKKYQTRKSPPYHAGDCKGSIKKGKDGTYISKADVRGVYKWVKVTVKVTMKTGKGTMKTTKNTKNNKSLFTFFKDLSSGKKVVVIYKDGTHKHVQLPNPTTTNYKNLFNEFDADPNVVAVLSTSLSMDDYESLRARAKDASVENIIKNYKKYFKTKYSLPKDLAAKGFAQMRKVRMP